MIQDILTTVIAVAIIVGCDTLTWKMRRKALTSKIIADIIDGENINSLRRSAATAARRECEKSLREYEPRIDSSTCMYIMKAATERAESISRKKSDDNYDRLLTTLLLQTEQMQTLATRITKIEGSLGEKGEYHE